MNNFNHTLFIVLSCIYLILPWHILSALNSVQIQELLNEYQKQSLLQKRIISSISWNYTLDPSKANERFLKNVTTYKRIFDNRWKIKLYKLGKGLDLDAFTINLITKIPYNPLYKNVAEYRDYQQSKSDLLKAYAQIRGQRKSFVCPYNIPPQNPLYEHQRATLTCSWIQHRTGPEKLLRKTFTKMAQAYKACCMDEAKTKTFASEYINETIVKIKPLYELLHAFVRHKLKEYYHMSDKDFVNGQIPLQLTENAWGQNWEGISTKIFQMNSISYKEMMNLLLKRGNLHIHNLTKLAELYFVSMGLPKLSNDFWTKSYISDYSNNSLCYPSAWNMFDGDDYRIMFCQKANYPSWLNVFHELGHIYYYMAYKKLPILLQMSPNLAFHESVGDTIALSALSPWSNLNSWPEFILNENQEMEFLLSQALRKFPLFMFAYSLEDWRHKALTGEIKPNDYNTEWWKAVAKYQGLSPPVPRSENNLDPAFKFHVVKNQNFLEYLGATVLQFQLLKILCYDSLKQNIPLHKCNLKNSKSAGKTLWNMMKLGGSYDWKSLLYLLTGKNTYDIEPLIEYFTPLVKYLEYQVNLHNIHTGWTF